MFLKIHQKFGKRLQIFEFLNQVRMLDTIFKKTLVYEDRNYGGKEKSVALLVEDLQI